MLAWPAELPQSPLKDGWTLGMPDGRLFNDMDAGPPLVRRRYSSAVTPMALSIEIDSNLMARFDRFWKEDTQGGVLPFLMRDPVYDGDALTTETGDILTDELGNILTVAAYWVVRFGKQSPQKINIGGRYYKISFNVDIMP
jgi:hypothetical protein